MPYIEVKRRRSRSGALFFHHALVSKKNGIRTRKYVCKAKVPSLKRELEEARALRRLKNSLLSAISNGRAGPVPKIPDYQRQLLKAAGFRLDGGMRIFRNRKTYYTLAAAAVRLSMKDSGLQAAIGTPDNLMCLERSAESMHKSLSVRRVSGISYETCLQKVIAEFLENHRNAGP